MYATSHLSFRPSPSVSASLGLVPSKISTELIRPSRSGSPFGPSSGSGHESSSSCSSAPSELASLGSFSASSDSPLSRGFRPFSTSQPSDIPSLSVSGSNGSVPYCDSTASTSPSPSESFDSPVFEPSPVISSVTAGSKSPNPSLVSKYPDAPTNNDPKIIVDTIAT